MAKRIKVAVSSLEEVEFEVTDSPKGPQATDVKRKV